MTTVPQGQPKKILVITVGWGQDLLRVSWWKLKKIAGQEYRSKTIVSLQKILRFDGAGWELWQKRPY